MAGARTNQALLVAVSGSFVTGIAMYAVGTGWNAWPTVLHGALGVAMVLLAPWKQAISRKGVGRRGWARSAPSLVLVVAVVTALVAGFAHRAGLRHVDPIPFHIQQLHVGAALVALPLVVWHVRSRPSQMRRFDPGRRNLLRGAALLGGATAVTVAVPHASDRFSRSLELGTFDPARMPATMWFTDTVQHLDPATWRLSVGERTWSLDDLEALRSDTGAEPMVATLDCTGGWYATQEWEGVPLGRLLAESGVGGGWRSVRVESSTGYWRRFPPSSVDGLLLATRVGGRPLSDGHGHPARLVAPGRRGFWWVKWVRRIDADGTPWWMQPPFPLT